MGGAGSGMVRPRMPRWPGGSAEVGVDGLADVAGRVGHVVGVFEGLVQEAVQASAVRLVAVVLEELLTGWLEADAGGGGIAQGPFGLRDAEPWLRPVVPGHRGTAGAHLLGVLLPRERLGPRPAAGVMAATGGPPV